VIGSGIIGRVLRFGLSHGHRIGSGRLRSNVYFMPRQRTALPANRLNRITGKFRFCAGNLIQPILNFALTPVRDGCDCRRVRLWVCRGTGCASHWSSPNPLIGFAKDA
jgi:hypothetical protein